MTNLVAGSTSVSKPWDTRRWLTLGVIALAQLMVVLDVTIMNIALPSAQRALHFGTADRQWVVTAYTLAFGSLLLLGGRLADLLGRKVTFLTGLVGFAGVSAIGGASVNFAMLVTARACQGAFAAILVPSALSLLTTTFSDPKDRGKAFGVYGAIAIAGGAVGLLLGGALTQYLSWRWTLYVNLVFAAVAFVGGALLLQRQASPSKPELDIPGVVLVGSAVFCLVYGCSNAASHRWGSPSTYGFLAAGGVLLGLFALWQGRAAHPLLPPRVVLDRNRGGAYASMFITGAGLFGTFFFLTFYMQRTLGFSPLVTGVAFLPISVGSAIVSNLSTIVLMPRFGRQAAGRERHADRVGRHGLAGPTGPAYRVRGRLAGPAHHGGGRHGHGDRPVDQHRHVWCGPTGRGGGICDGHCRPATRRLDRDVPVEHHLRRRRRVISGRPPRHLLGRPSDPDRVGSGTRLRHHVLVDRRNSCLWRHYRRGPVASWAVSPGGSAVSGPRPGNDGASRGRPAIT